MKVTEQYFPVVLFIMLLTEVVLTFQSVDKGLCHAILIYLNKLKLSSNQLNPKLKIMV